MAQRSSSATRQAPGPSGFTAPRIGRRPGLAESWKAQPVSLRLLRAFLGATFTYAGIQKLADPNFLHAGTVDYIGSQLRDFSRGSPIASVLHALAHAPVLTGLAVALLEIAVGLGTLLGIAPVTAAAAGLGINLVLFLSATWHVHPYFLGSDSMYAVAWGAYLIALVEARRKAARVPIVGHRRRSDRADPTDLRRREFMRAGLLGAGTLLVAGVARAFAGAPATVTRTPSGPTRATGGGTKTPAAPEGTVVASLDSVPVGGAIAFNAPGGGGPAVLLRPSSDQVEAFSRICTHAGCLVGYDESARLLVCPCHGAEFDPSRGARPVAGPAFSPLRKIPVAIDRQNGEIVAT